MNIKCFFGRHELKYLGIQHQNNCSCDFLGMMLGCYYLTRCKNCPKEWRSIWKKNQQNVTNVVAPMAMYAESVENGIV